MTVARRFIAGSRTTWGLRPGGTPEYRRAIKRRECISDGPSPISIAPPASGARSISKHEYRR